MSPLRGDALLKKYVKNTTAGPLIGGATGVLACLLTNLKAILYRTGPVAPVSLLRALLALSIAAVIGGLDGRIPMNRPCSSSNLGNEDRYGCHRFVTEPDWEGIFRLRDFL
jgi:hypothetical protein